MTSQKSNKANVVSELMPQDIEYQAAHWLAVLDGDDPSTKQIAAFHRWKTENEAHRQAFEDLLALWGSANILTRLQPPLRKGQASTAVGQLHQPGGWLGTTTLALQTRWLGATTFALLLVVTLLSVQPWLGIGGQTYTTAVGEQKTIVLADNSTVLLNTDSQLRVQYQSDRRLLTLAQGEAHFEVAHDPQRPFEVFAGSGRVQALGTAFTVRMAQQGVSVFVTEGVVEVSSETAASPAAAAPLSATANPAAEGPAAGETASVAALAASDTPTLTPTLTRTKVPAGLQAVYGAEGSHIDVARAADIDDKLSWHQGKLVFNGEPLATVIDEFNRYTAVKIIVPSKAMRNMKVGGIFKIGDTTAMLDALHSGFGIQAKYVAEDIVYLEYVEQ